MLKQTHITNTLTLSILSHSIRTLSNTFTPPPPPTYYTSSDMLRFILKYVRRFSFALPTINNVTPTCAFSYQGQLCTTIMCYNVWRVANVIVFLCIPTNSTYLSLPIIVKYISCFFIYSTPDICY